MTVCANCKEREGTERWVGDSSAIGWIHMTPQMWCRLCCAREQLAHAQKLAATIPALEAEIASLTEPV
jgi:hypothetical protein